MENNKFKPPPYLIPTHKSYTPFFCWCVDTIVKLSEEDGDIHLMVCVCAVSKWVEAIPVSNKSSLTMAKMFHEHIVCRFGVPGIVRVDRGTEYRGDFASYLKSIGIQVCVISTAHPRSNGLVERYNRVLK